MLLKSGHPHTFYYVALLTYRIKKIGIQNINILPVVWKVILCIFDIISIHIRIKEFTLPKLGAVFGVSLVWAPL